MSCLQPTSATSVAVPESIERVPHADLGEDEMILIDSMTSGDVAAKRSSKTRFQGSTHRLLALLVISPLLVASTMLDSARAGGLYVNEFSTAVQGNAGAGRGAWAPDASATLHNPASMIQHDDHAFATGFSLFAGDGPFRFFDGCERRQSSRNRPGRQFQLCPQGLRSGSLRTEFLLHFGIRSRPQQRLGGPIPGH